jgi:hypothetical protein
MPNESNEESKDGRIRVTLHPSIVKNIKQKLPEHQRDRPFSFVVDDLLAERLETSVDSSLKISGPPGRYSYSSNSSSFEELESLKGRETFLTPVSENFICHDPEKHKAFLKETKKTAAKDSPAFQIWWETYNAAPNKSSNQSKSKARTAWKEAVKNQTPEKLIEAAKRAVKDQARKIGADQWVAPFPDAHRWLRDECYTVFLEGIKPTQEERIIPGVTAL